ncbi:MAG: hypothetical protein ISR78_03810 [Spirochaetia bacterium]|nr:hypothetical protein [Spirochaetia bacterium]
MVDCLLGDQPFFLCGMRDKSGSLMNSLENKIFFQKSIDSHLLNIHAFKLRWLIPQGFTSRSESH